jgi:hypothetical protein
MILSCQDHKTYSEKLRTFIDNGIQIGQWCEREEGEGRQSTVLCVRVDRDYFIC